MKSLKYFKEKRDFNRTEFGITSIDSFIKEFIYLLKKNNVFTQNVIESYYELENRVRIYGFDILKVDSIIEDNEDEAFKIVFITGDYFSLNGDIFVDLKVIKRQIEGINRLLKKIKARKFQFGDVNKLEGLQSFILTNNIVEFDVVYLTDAKISAHQTKLQSLIDNYSGFTNFEFFDITVVDDLLDENRFSKICIEESMFQGVKMCTQIESSSIVVYSTYFTGSELFELYRKFNRRLYDNNVRLFLDTKRKGNAAMVRTILENPGLFISYNNGLSIVAENVVVDNNAIKEIEGLSVVNGGQTLATIFYTGKKYGIESLNDVAVVAKISCLKVHEPKMVSNISKASNTQTAIKSSDFSSNLEEFVLFQRFTQWFNLPNGESGFQYAFFERMQGERNDMIKRAPDNKTKIEYSKKYPAKYSFVKTELSRVCHLINGNISMAANSAEKQFEVFIDHKIGLLSELRIENYIKILSVVILFNRFRLYCGKKGSVKYPPVGEPSAGMTISIYACGMFLRNNENTLNYLSVFEEKSDSLDNVIFGYLKESWRVLEILGGAMLQEKAKKKEFELEFLNRFNFQAMPNISNKNSRTNATVQRSLLIIEDFIEDTRR